MTKIRLEIEEIKIHRPKKRWNLYFIFLTEHPNIADKMILTTLPTQPIRLSPSKENVYSFEAEGAGSDGLFVLERKMPENRRMNVQCYLRHSRNRLRNVGEILSDMKGALGVDAFDIVEDVVGKGIPWLEVSKNVIPKIGTVITKIKDRDFGFLNMNEEFGDEFENQTELDRANDFTGDASLVWSWSVKD